MAARLLTTPLDTIKIRWQLLQSPSNSKIGLWGMVRDIYLREGWRAFWRGSLSGLGLYGAYGAIQFSLYERMPFTQAGLKGGLAAAGATIATYPLDLLRTRMALQRRTNWRVLRDIIELEEGGVRALYRGLLPTLLQVTPYMACTFAIFEAVKASLLLVFPSRLSLTDAMAGLVAGVVGKTAILPLDNLRKRLQVQTIPQTRSAYTQTTPLHQTNAWACAREMWTREGWRCFYRGWLLAIGKTGPTTMITMLVYHGLKRAKEV